MAKLPKAEVKQMNFVDDDGEEIVCQVVHYGNYIYELELTPGKSYFRHNLLRALAQWLEENPCREVTCMAYPSNLEDQKHRLSFHVKRSYPDDKPF